MSKVSLTVRNTEDREKNEPENKLSRRIRREHTCPFCDQTVGNFSRHLERQHDNEVEVQKFKALNINFKERKKLIDKIRKEGHFCTSEVITIQQLQIIEKDNYVPCLFCKGYYARKSLRRHAKSYYFNPDPSQKRNVQAEGQSIMSGYFGHFEDKWCSQHVKSR